MTNFLDNLHSFGTLTVNRKPTRVVDRLARMKTTFKTRAQSQVNSLQGAAPIHDGRQWFQRVESSKGNEVLFVASLRNGTKTLPLQGAKKYMEVNSEELLVEFFKKAIDACERGELDQLLLATAPKPRVELPPEYTAADAINTASSAVRS